MRARPVVALVASVALLAVGCGGSGAEERTGNKVVVVQGVDPTTMDPLQHRETTTANVLQHFYDSLIERSATNPQEFESDLAKSWKRLNETTVRLRLRSGVKFADGSSFDAGDVKYTMEYLLGKLPGRDPAIAAYQYGTVKGAKVVDAHTVDIVTKEPDPLLLSRVAALMIVPEGAVDKDPKALASDPNGTGPYKFVKWDRNNKVVMKAKSDYFRGKPAIKKVVFKTITEASSRLAALKAGQVDIITNLPADNVAEIKASGTARVERVNSARIASVWLNVLESEPLKSAKVRRALNYAVNVDAIIKSVMSGNGTRVATLVPPYFENYDPSIKPIPYDPAKAKDLLASAGYKKGFSMELMVPRGRYEFAADVSQAIAGQLGKVGVKVKINTVDFGVFAKATQERKIPDGFYGAWGEEYFNPIDEFNVAVASGTTGFSWYSNKKVDKLIDRAGRTLDKDKQQQLVSQIQRILLRDPPFIFLFAYKDIYGVSKRLDWSPRSDESIYIYDAKLKS